MENRICLPDADGSNNIVSILNNTAPGVDIHPRGCNDGTPETNMFLAIHLNTQLSNLQQSVDKATLLFNLNNIISIMYVNPKAKHLFHSISGTTNLIKYLESTDQDIILRTIKLLRCVWFDVSFFNFDDDCIFPCDPDMIPALFQVLKDKPIEIMIDILCVTYGIMKRSPVGTQDIFRTCNYLQQLKELLFSYLEKLFEPENLQTENLLFCEMWKSICICLSVGVSDNVFNQNLIGDTIPKILEALTVWSISCVDSVEELDINICMSFLLDFVSKALYYNEQNQNIFLLYSGVMFIARLLIGVGMKNLNVPCVHMLVEVLLAAIKSSKTNSDSAIQLNLVPVLQALLMNDKYKCKTAILMCLLELCKMNNHALNEFIMNNGYGNLRCTILQNGGDANVVELGQWLLEMCDQTGYFTQIPISSKSNGQ